MEYGIAGKQAPELSSDIYWINNNGQETDPILLSDYNGKFKVIYGFQSWCPGCHSRGLPSLQKMVNALDKNKQVTFFAVQTVFEGIQTNTKDKLIETQNKYELKIPFGHDIGTEKTGNRSSIMHDYRTGGTPWLILINPAGKVVYNHFHVKSDELITYVETQLG